VAISIRRAEHGGEGHNEELIVLVVVTPILEAALIEGSLDTGRTIARLSKIVYYGAAVIAIDKNFLCVGAEKIYLGHVQLPSNGTSNREIYEGLGMQPGRAEASPIKPKKLVSSSARTRCKSVRFSPSLPSRIVTVAVKPDTSGTPGGTLSIAIRTGTRCAKRTQV
jgi:hypothetical protein